MVKSQWTQSKRQLFHKLSFYLPKKHVKNTTNPILYLTDGKEIKYLYSFDQIKKVAYTSDIYYQEYDYMSIFEIYYEGWEIVNQEKAYNILVPLTFEMPF